MVGVPAEARPPLPLQEMFRREIDLRFAIGDPIRERDRILSMLRTRQVDVADVLGEVVRLDEVPAEFSRFARGERQKVVVAL